MGSDVEGLRFREYWRVGECVEILALDEAYWRGRFESGILDGFEECGQIYIAAASARAHLKNRCEERQSGIAVEVALKKLRAETEER